MNHKQNRTLAALCLSSALLFSVIGCTFSAAPAPGTDEHTDTQTLPDTEPYQTESGTSEETDVPEPDDAEEAAALAALLQKDLPKMDGSTSAIPLEAAVRSGIFGITPEEAQKDVQHSTSHDSFYHLLDGECSLAFSHLLSPEQYAAAEERGIAIEMIPVAREGFVFLVSAENPVDSLTSDEVKRIYSGEITNWSEVGGNDMPITAYQRNIDSGSQNYMRAFMGDVPLTDAPLDLRPGNMDTLVDCVASYDGEKNGIGYSVFSYVDGMYDAEGGVKLLKIDGTEPEYGSICDGSYPCTGYNYVVIRADEEENSPARNMVSWILSSAGQKAIAKTGYYAPLMPSSHVDITIPDLHLMTAVGTGKETCTPADWCYFIRFDGKPYESGYPDGTQRLPIEGTSCSDVIRYSDVTLPDTGNTALDAEIKAFADASFSALAQSLHASPKDVTPDSVFAYHSERDLHAYSDFACVNGYLSVSVHIQVFGGDYSVNPGFSAVWDLESGKRLALSDLFRRNAPFVPMLNSAIRHMTEIDASFGYPEPARTIRAFEGLTEGFDNFGITYGWDYENPKFGNSPCFFIGLHPDNNPYFENDIIVPVAVQENDLCLLSEPRSLGGAYGEEIKVLWHHSLGSQKRTEIPLTGGEFGEKYTYWGEYRWTEFEGFPGAEKINEAQRAFREKHSDIASEICTEEFVRRVGTEMADILKWNLGLVNPTAEQLGTACVIIEETAYPIGSRYAAVSCQVRVQHLEWVGYGGGVIIDPICVIYDLETGDAVPFSEIFSQPYSGEWQPDTGTQKFPDSGKLGDPVMIQNGTDPGTMYLTFELSPGERYTMEIRHDTLRILDAS